MYSCVTAKRRERLRPGAVLFAHPRAGRVVCGVPLPFPAVSVPSLGAPFWKSLVVCSLVPPGRWKEDWLMYVGRSDLDPDKRDHNNGCNGLDPACRRLLGGVNLFRESSSFLLLIVMASNLLAT